MIITRFAPSPTGFLHIGSARTALFSWLYARRNKGKFLLRIEDTDRERSTDAAIDAIIEGMKWLGLEQDGEIIFQFARASRHAAVAKQLVEQGKAYYCYHTQEELAAMREATMQGGPKLRSKWRDGGAPREGVKPVVRLKAPIEGETTIHDLVQGTVTVANSQLDDMVMLRSDGTPTYMLAVVVDDHDMQVTHVIRGDDHLTNASRQKLIYEAMGWDVPEFAHIPLIHGPDGAKLSKRHGALGVEAYRNMGYLPEALRNYLLRLGWSHGDEEIISTEQAIEWFNLEAIGKSPARFDFKKLENINGHYIREAADERLVELITPILMQRVNRPISDEEQALLQRGMAGLKPRAKTIVELAENAQFYVQRPALNEKAAKAVADNKALLPELITLIENFSNWQHEALFAAVKEFAEGKGQKVGAVAGMVRALLTGSDVSPSVFEIMEALGRELSLERLKG